MPKFNLNWMYMIIALMLLGLWWGSDSRGAGNKAVTYSEFQDYVKNGYVSKVLGYEDKSIEAYLKPNSVGAVFGADSTKVGRNPIITSRAPSTDKLEEFLQAEKEAGHFDGTSDYPPKSDIFPAILIQVLPLVLLIALWIFFMRRMSGGGSGGPGGVFNVGKSKAQLFEKGGAIKITFKDVAGLAEAKQEVEEIVEFLKEPQKYTDLGGKIPKGALLVGPPGTGKTLLAKAVAGEANVPFFSLAGSDFVEMFVGVGASRVRDLFEQAKKSAPCIVFIDEIDAVGRQRGAGLGGGHDEREQTLNQLLVEMDGFGANEGIIMIAATNRPDILDPALLRPGRFDRQIVVDRPDIKGRREILKVHVKGKPVGSDVELDVIARRTPGFTGADLSNLVNEAALMAARRNKKQINMPDMEEAAERVIMGPERRSRVISDNEKRLTAYHEGGHTLVGMLLDNADPVHKVTIIPRGRAGGYTLSLPKEDRYYATRSEMLDELKVLLGGRVAEALVLKEISSGASNDLQRATSLARQMICEYGMSTELGPVTFGHRQDQVFLGRDIARDKNYSEEIAAKIDKEIRKFLDEAYQKTEELLQNNIDKLHLIAQALIEKETLEGSEIEQLMKYGRILDKNEQPPDDNSGTPAVIPPDAVTVPAAEAQPQAAPQYQEVPGVVSTEEKHALN